MDFFVTEQDNGVVREGAGGLTRTGVDPWGLGTSFLCWVQFSWVRCSRAVLSEMQCSRAMQCRVRCGFAGGRSRSKQQLLKVIQTHNLLLPALSFLAAAIFSSVLSFPSKSCSISFSLVPYYTAFVRLYFDLLFLPHWLFCQKLCTQVGGKLRAIAQI